MTVTDNSASDIGDALSAETTFTIVVMNFNDAPVLNAAAPFLPELTEDDVDNDGTTVELLIGNTITDVDPDSVRGIAVWAAEGDSWQYRTADADTWAALVAVSESAALLLQPDARVRFVPDGEFGENPNPTISYFAWDQTFIPPPENDVQVRGDGTPFSVDSDTATVVVTDVNDPPVAANVTVSEAEEAGLITMTLTATDIESESADNFTFMVKTPPSGREIGDVVIGDIVFDAGTFSAEASYIHDGSENESDSFTFVAYDGVDESAAATVSVTIAPTNDAPVIADESVTVTMHEDNGVQNPVDPDTGLQDPLPLTFALSLTATDIDSATLTWSIVSAPANGEAEVISSSGTGDPTDLENGNQAQFTYAPNADYPGSPASATDTFTVQVSDGELSDTIEVNVVVEQINDAPILVNALSDETIMATEAFHKENSTRYRRALLGIILIFPMQKMVWIWLFPLSWKMVMRYLLGSPLIRQQELSTVWPLMMMKVV